MCHIQKRKRSMNEKPARKNADDKKMREKEVRRGALLLQNDRVQQLCRLQEQ
jgi:hypothetical protein